MNNSFRDEGKTIYDFLKEFYAKCPQCDKFAYVKSIPDDRGSYLFYKKRILTCDNCGCTKIYKSVPGAVGNDFPLWLESNCCGNKLWAYNLAHLEYIEKYVAAAIRQDYKSETGYKNTSILARLPNWLKDGNHRGEILKCIERMKTTVPANYIEKSKK